MCDVYTIYICIPSVRALAPDKEVIKWLVNYAINRFCNTMINR